MVDHSVAIETPFLVIRIIKINGCNFGASNIYDTNLIDTI
jgi:hypothetical protein